MNEAVNPSRKFARRRRLLAAWLLASSLILGFVFTDARYILPAQAPVAKALAGLVQPSPIIASEPFFAIPLRNARRLAREIAAVAPPAPRPITPEPQIPGAIGGPAPAVVVAPQPGDTIGLIETVPPPTLTPIPTFTNQPPGVFTDPPPVVIPEEPEPTGVPEPSTWFMLIAGFFGVGVALRRRRGLAPVAQL